jgi:LysM repeat protein
MKAPALIAIVVAVHLLVIGGFVFMQGCGTSRQAVEPPPAPVMPPQETVEPVEPIPAEPVFRPPVTVEAVPESMDWEGTDTYQVKRGDTLSEIAKRHGLSTRELADLNNLKDADRIVIGQKLIIPSHAGLDASEMEPSVSAPVSASGTVVSDEEGTYVVQKGDVLSRIAVRHGTTVSAIKDANNLAGDKILIGQKLIIPGGAGGPGPAPEPVAATEAEPLEEMPEIPSEEITLVEEEVTVVSPDEPDVSDLVPEKAFIYTVAEGDTLDSVARSFVVLKEDLVEANDLSEEDGIEPGQKLVIPMTP